MTISFTAEELDRRIPHVLCDGAGRHLICYSKEQAEALLAKCENPGNWRIYPTTWGGEGLGEAPEPQILTFEGEAAYG